MRVLVACERSGIVRRAFTDRGHDAYSCDLRKPLDFVFSRHLRGDALQYLDPIEHWDLVIAFPPCTHLTKTCANLWPKKRADGTQAKAAEFFMAFMEAPFPRIAVENPVGVMSTIYRKPDQIVQPWMFGDPWKKTTCLWLKGLPPLVPTKVVDPKGSWVSSGKVHCPRSVRDPARRAETFPGLALAMAEQWGAL